MSRADTPDVCSARADASLSPAAFPLTVDLLRHALGRVASDHQATTRLRLDTLRGTVIDIDIRVASIDGVPTEQLLQAIRPS